MLRRIFLFSSALLLLLSCGWNPVKTGAVTDQEYLFLPLVTTPPSPVYLPLIMKPWLDSSFGIEAITLDNTAASRAEEADTAWVRINGLQWLGYQPNNSTEFRTDPALEQELINASQIGAKAILIIHRTPLWAREYLDSVCGPISSDKLDEFANFMQKVVQKYSQPPFNVMYYELWNEPDHFLVRDNPGTLRDESNMPYGCWGDPQDTEFYGGGYYAEVLRAISPAMKSVNPNVKIVLGGLLLDCDPATDCAQKNMSNYFAGILNAGGSQFFDVVNFHAYNYYATNVSPIQREFEIPNWLTRGGQIEGKLAFLRQVMAQYDISKPIILSEAGLICYGCTTFPDQFQQDKAEYVTWLYTRNWAKGLMATTWYTLDKGGWQGTGMLDAENNPLPAYYAFKTMTETLYGTAFSMEITPITGVTAFEFIRGSKTWVLFSMDGSEKVVDTSQYGQVTEAFDMYGKACDGTTYCNINNGQLTFTRPVYLRFD
jgi:hypothetical protein